MRLVRLLRNLYIWEIHVRYDAEDGIQPSDGPIFKYLLLFKNLEDRDSASSTQIQQ
jgi:hypothetical protein